MSRLTPGLSLQLQCSPLHVPSQLTASRKWLFIPDWLSVYWQVSALENGNSFNTILQTANAITTSVAIINQPGQPITIQGSTNSAKLLNEGVAVCSANPVSPPAPL